jgi:hypothetical protein
MSSRLTTDRQFVLATKPVSPKEPLLLRPLRLDYALLSFHSHGPTIQRGTAPAMTTTAKERLNAIPRSA